MENELVIPDNPDLESWVSYVTVGLNSEKSQKSYTTAIKDFSAWWVDKGCPSDFSRRLIEAYKADLLIRTVKKGGRKGEKLTPSTINLYLSCVRRLADKFYLDGFISDRDHTGIKSVKRENNQGYRAGNWLNLEQCRLWIDSIEGDSLAAIRNRAIVALLLGTALRVSELAGLTVSKIQYREAQPCIIDFIGKGRKVRSIAIPKWCFAFLTTWLDRAGISEGAIFRKLNKLQKIRPVGNRAVTSQAIYQIVIDTSKLAGLTVKPHDCRRTCALFTRKQGGGSLEEVSNLLGHSELSTTQRYLSASDSLINTANTRWQLE